MATNEEILMKHGINYACETFPRETYNEDLELMDLARAEGYKEGQKDTANQIFAELEAIKDEYGNPLLDTLYGKGRQYARVKMKYTNKSALCKNCHKPIYYSDGTWYHLSDGNAQCETPITYAEPDEALIKKEGD